MADQRYNELVSGIKCLEGVKFNDFCTFSKSRAETILASTDMPLNNQAELMRLHCNAQSQSSGGVGGGERETAARGPGPFTIWPNEAVSEFDSMNLQPELLRGVKSFGIERPAPVQQCAIAPIAKGMDVIMQAPVGTGKTVALSVGILQRIDPRHNAVQALIVCPSHEEAEHADDLLSHVGEFMAEGKQNFSATFFGRTRMRWDDRKFDSGVIIAVGTPVRLLDLIRRGSLRTGDLKVIAFDNIDDLLYDFSREAYALARVVPRDIQFVMSSTTLPTDALDFAHWFLKDPKRILVKESPIPDGVKQYMVSVPDANDARLDKLCEVLKSAGDTPAIVFCNTRWKVNWVAERLQDRLKCPVSCVHADRLRQDRDNDLDAFKRGATKVLITTEKLSAGVDPQQKVRMIVNFDLPFTEESYMLRIGRVGRFGHKAVVVNFENPGEIGTLGWFETRCGTRIEPLTANFIEHCKC